jgi:hypothetical protein
LAERCPGSDAGAKEYGLTFDPDQQGRLFNLVVRGLAFLEDRLLVSRWQGGFCFPVGGRLQYGRAWKRQPSGSCGETFFVDDSGQVEDKAMTGSQRIEVTGAPAAAPVAEQDPIKVTKLGFAEGEITKAELGEMIAALS